LQIKKKYSKKASENQKTKAKAKEEARKVRN